MMTSEYDASTSSPNYSQFEPRRSSGTPSAGYDRPVLAPSRHRSPSPGPSRRPYDSYMPRADNLQYRSPYRPPVHRSEYAGGSYYDHSSSPDTYGPRPQIVTTRDRDTVWRFPPSRSYDVSENRAAPLSPARRFEPSESWKQSHVDHPANERTSDHHFHRRSRGSIDSSPERVGRIDRSLPSMSGGDRYRSSPPKRESYQLGRSEYDSYRPPHSQEPLRRGDAPLSPIHHTGQVSRRDSGSSGPRLHERSDWPHSFQKRSSDSSGSVLATPGSAWPVPPWNSPPYLEAPYREPPTRQPSRSSIASSHVSDRRSPGLASIPQPSPSIPLPAHLPAKPEAAINALRRKQDFYAETKPGVVIDHPTPKPLNLHTVASQNLTEDTLRECSNQSSSEANIPANPFKEVPPMASAMAPIGLSADLKADETLSSPSEIALLNNIATTNFKGPAPSSSQPATNHSPVFAVEEPTPSPTIEAPLSSREDAALNIDIPPAIHSPDASHDKGPDEPGPVLAHSDLPRPDEIPSLTSAKNKQEALRIVVMTRLVRDYQSREARVEPIMLANRAIAPDSEAHPFATPESLIERMFDDPVRKVREESAVRVRPMLVKYFETRQVKIDDKLRKLQKEYLALQDQWLTHCHTLNEQQKTLVSEQENQHPMRTTRRTMAVTDTVRSDFEMEQIIASLGNDDATDPNHLSIRNLAKIPDMISAVEGQVIAVYDDNNYLVENPTEYYQPDTGMHDWTDAEKLIFLEKFGASPKQFGIIADSLPNKTAAQCVAYYYLHKKNHIDFRKIIAQYAPNKRKRRGMGRKRGGGLLADIAMHDMEVHRGAGAASPASASAPVGRPTRGRRSLAAIAGSASAKPTSASRRNAIQFEETPGSTPTPEPESGSRTTRRRKVVTSSVSVVATPGATPDPASVSTPVSSSVQFTASASTTIEEDEHTNSEARPSKRAKRTRKIKSAATIAEEPGSPTPPLPINEVNTNSSPKKKEKGAGAGAVHWSDEEKQLFLSLLSTYGDDFKSIAAFMPGKTTLQVTNYYKVHQAELQLGTIVARAPNSSSNLELSWVSPHPRTSTPPPETAPRQSSFSAMYSGSVSGTTPYLLIPPRDTPTPWNGQVAPTWLTQGVSGPSDNHTTFDPKRSRGYSIFQSPPASRYSGLGIPRISTSIISPSALLSSATVVKDISTSSTAPPPSGATAIVHSPTIPSPKVAAQRQAQRQQPQSVMSSSDLDHTPRGDRRVEHSIRQPPNHSPIELNGRPRSNSAASHPSRLKYGPSTHGTRSLYPHPGASPPVGVTVSRGAWSESEMFDSKIYPHHWSYDRGPVDQPQITRSPVDRDLYRRPSSSPYSARDSHHVGSPEVGRPIDPGRRGGWYP